MATYTVLRTWKDGTEEIMGMFRTMDDAIDSQIGQQGFDEAEGLDVTYKIRMEAK